MFYVYSPWFVCMKSELNTIFNYSSLYESMRYKFNTYQEPILFFLVVIHIIK